MSVRHLAYFKDLTVTTAQKLIDFDYQKEVIDHLTSFESSTREQIKKKVNKKEQEKKKEEKESLYIKISFLGNAIATGISNFQRVREDIQGCLNEYTSLTQSEIVEEFIEWHQGRSVAEHLDCFSELNLTIAKKLVDLGYVKEVRNNKTSFAEEASEYLQEEQKNGKHFAKKKKRGRKYLRQEEYAWLDDLLKEEERFWDTMAKSRYGKSFKTLTASEV